MAHQTVTVPESEGKQIEELDLLFRLGTPFLVGPDGDEKIPLPPTVFGLLKGIIRDMQCGKSIVLLREDEELTSQTAANVLGVSRPHLIKLLEAKKIPFHKTGSHRRVCLKDVLAYAKDRDARRKALLNEMARDAFESGLYDDAEMPPGGDDE